MKIVCLILGMLCLGYYGVILGYAGSSSNFIKVWAAAGIFFLGVSILLFVRERYGILAGVAIPIFVRRGAAVFIIVGILLFVTVEGFIFHAMMQQPDAELDYLIVLGAHVKGEVPSKALYKRLYRAEEYLKENPGTKAVLSGGKGKGETITEAEAMRRYLEKSGIDDGRLFLEECSTDTKENIQFSMEIIKDFDASIGVVTNDFHIFRGTAIGRKMGCRNIQGVPAKGDAVMEINYLTREFFAVIKDKWVGNI